MWNGNNSILNIFSLELWLLRIKRTSFCLNMNRIGFRYWNVFLTMLGSSLSFFSSYYSSKLCFTDLSSVVIFWLRPDDKKVSFSFNFSKKVFDGTSNILKILLSYKKRKRIFYRNLMLRNWMFDFKKFSFDFSSLVHMNEQQTFGCLSRWETSLLVFDCSKRNWC